MPVTKPSPTAFAKLSPEQQALLVKRLMHKKRNQNGQAQINQPPIIPVNRQSHLPASFSQQSLWFLYQLNPTDTAYNMPAAVKLVGMLDRHTLTQAIYDLVDRHESLRTTFGMIDDVLVQSIHPAQKISLSFTDLQSYPTATREEQLHELLAQAATRPFNLQHGPLFHVELYQLQTDTYVFFFSMHHIISDGVSMGIFIQELAELYLARKQQQPHTLAPLQIQYADYAHWQRNWLTPEKITEQLIYWQQHLKGAPALLELPTDYNRPAIQTFQGRTLRFALPMELTQQVREFSRQQGMTLYMALFTAFATLLYRYSGQSDFVIGSPVANRTHTQIQALIGYFVNTLALRVQFAENMTVQDAFVHIKEVTLAAFSHQQMPFERVVDAVQPARCLSYTPLFQVMFDLAVMPAAELDLPGLHVSPYELDETTSKFDLTLTMSDTGDALTGELEYSTALFTEATIQRFVAHFQTLLAAMLSHPETPIARLSYLTLAERHQLLIAWNQTEVCFSNAHLCVHQLIERWAQQTPTTTAVVHKGERLSYADLNEKANQLAHYLLSLGVTPDTCIGIYLERSLETIIALLGVLKAGGAYLPLDPSYPTERLAFMMVDSKSPILLTQTALANDMPATQATIVRLDAEWESEIGAHPTTNPTSPVQPHHLAYIIYTSGSTGQPKGVMITHRNLTNAYLGWEKAYGLKTDARNHLQMASFSFDVFCGDFARALCSGGKLVLCPRALLLTPDKLYQLMCAEQIDCAEFVPVVIRALAQYLTQTEQNLHFMRLLVVGSDSWYIKEYQAFQQLCGPQTRFVNSYGVSECTIDTLYFEAESLAHLPHDMLVPVGRPFPNMHAYILDANKHPVPVGITGELYIGGRGVGRGYLNQPTLTAERFVPNPFDTGNTIYRTGDAARYLQDGNIEFLGRIDTQVKVRGFRIELGEIESVMARYPGVAEAVAAVKENDSGHKRLVGYFRCQDETPVAVSDLRHFLKTVLPDYMVPAHFMTIMQMPLTPNGKIDRRALPEPDETANSVTYVAPETTVQKQLATIWSQVLGIKKVGITDNFFELGGDSILTIQIVARANQAGLKIKPRHLFEHQTIAALAPYAETETPVIAPQGVITGLVHLTPIQQDFWTQSFPVPHHYNQSILLKVPAACTSEIIDTAFAILYAHHDCLRLRFTQTKTGWEQVIAPVTDSPVCVLFDLTSLPSAEQTATLEAQAAALQASLDISNGPILRTALFTLSPKQPKRLLIIIHHLAVDGVSWRILLEDLQTLYMQLQQKQPVQLPPKTTSYQQWAENLVAHTQSTALAAEIPYWLAPERRLVKPLRTDEPLVTVLTAGDLADVTVALSATQTAHLLQQVPAAYNTRINDVLLAALAQTITDWSGTESVLIALEGHGREDLFDDIDLSRTLGWFTAVYPLLLQVNTDEPGNLLKSIKEQLRAVPQNGFGYGLLRYLSPANVVQQLQTMPMPMIGFNYLGQIDQVTAETEFGAAAEATGPETDPANPTPYSLEINGSVVNGQLELTWSYHTAVYHRSTMTALVAAFQQTLAGLIQHCIQPNAGGLTPSDFPETTLTQAQLDKLIANLHTSDAKTPKHKQIEDIYPLSPVQEGMLFHTQLAPQSGVYFEQLNCTLQGVLDESAFVHAWQMIIDRHPVLRTQFVWEGVNQPVQVVRKHAEATWQMLDWQHLSATEQQVQLDAFLAAEWQQGFDMGCAPLMRFSLIRRGPQRYELVWSHHHILMDGWSTPRLLQETFAFYNAAVAGETIHLPQPRPYREYIAWLQRQDSKKAQHYWQTLLQGLQAPTPLPVAAPTSPQTVLEETATYDFYLSIAESEVLQQLARRHHLTLSTLVQGAWGLLLSRYANQDDVVFGVTVSGRPAELSGVEEMVGLFINTLPIRVKVSPDQPLLDWLQEIQAQQVAQGQYAYTPLVQIQGWSDIPRGMPLFETIVVFENFPSGTAPETEISRHLLIEDAQSFDRTNYPITLTVSLDEQSRVAVSVDYDVSRFDVATIERMSKHWIAILRAVAAEPERPLANISLVTDAERAQLLEGFNSCRGSYPVDKSLAALFERQAAATPGNLAVRHGNTGLTYAQLNAQANRLAHHLRQAGAGPNRFVGLLAARSTDFVIGMLAIFKAGAAYIPIDAGYPPDRIAFMLQDSAAPLLVTQSQLLDKVATATAVSDIFLLDTPAAPGPNLAAQLHLPSAWQQAPQTNPAPLNQPTDLAYLLYTSGSTGRPKGALLRHNGAINHIFAEFEALAFHAGSTFLQSAPASSDISVWQFLGPLLIGGCTVVANYETVTSPPDLFALLRETRVTVMELVPVLLQTLLDYVATLPPQDRALPDLEWAMITGETAPVPLVNRWLTTYPHIPMVNAYGPTEAADDVCQFVMRQPLPEGMRRVPIGTPIANMRLYVLDPQLQLLPIGVPGEICVAGIGVGAGYWQQSQKTAACFVANPYATHEQEATLYRTGDLGRWLPDGNLDFLGRIDNQVQFRGFRIELGEIEAVLAQQPGVQEAAVLVRTDQPDLPRLVAYTVPQPGADLAPAMLRRGLQSQLPGYMTPSLFVSLSQMPLTPAGKIDRRALPQPADEAPPSSHPYTPPRHTHEKTLALIWQDMLGIAKIGIHDNFFELGGDSILTIQIIAQAAKAGIKFTPRQIFQYQTIAKLAQVVTDAAIVQAEQGVVTGEAPLIPSQHWFFAQDLPEPHHYNQSTIFTVPPDLDFNRLMQVVTVLLHHHDALRMRYQCVNGLWQQTNSVPDALQTVCLSYDLSHLPATKHQSAIAELAADLQAGLNLTNGPLLRVAHISLGQKLNGRLLIIIHHLVMDGVSWRILLEDLVTGYEQLRAGSSVQLSAKTTAFRTWAQKLSAYAQSNQMQTEQAYWLDETRAWVSPLPVDNGDLIRNIEGNTNHLIAHLDAAHTQQLLRDVPQAYNTQINDILLAALAKTVAEWIGDSLVLIDQEGHGREDLFEDVDLSRTVGWFTSLFPMLLEVDFEWSDADLIKSVKEQIRNVPQRGIGYGLLRYGGNRETQQILTSFPEPEISFNYLGQFDQVLSSTDLFGDAPESSEPDYSPAGKRPYLLEIDASIGDGQLHVDWSYCPYVHDEETIVYLSAAFQENLIALINHCVSPEAGGYTPSDFAAARISTSDLDKILSKLDDPSQLL